MSGISTSNECVVGVFQSVSQAQLAVHILDRAGIVPERVSLVTRHLDPTSKEGRELNWGDDSLRDAAIGGTLGGLAGIIGNVAVFAITGVGAVIFAGPLVAATGGVVGAFLGAMKGWGVHESQIQRYERLVREGKVLVVVDGDPEQLADAERMLRQTDPLEVYMHAATSDDSPEVDDRPQVSR